MHAANQSINPIFEKAQVGKESWQAGTSFMHDGNESKALD